MATDFYTNAFADNVRLAKSRSLITPAAATYNVIRIPKFAFVTDVWLLVGTAANAAPTTCQVGWSGNGETAVAAGFLSTDISDATVAGLKRAMRDTLVSFPGKYFSGGSGAITFTYNPGAATTGIFWIFAQYIVVH